VRNSLLYLCCPPGERRPTEKLLRSAGFAPRWAEDAPEALAALDERESVVLADFADARVARLVREIRRRRPGALLLAITDTARRGAQEEIERAGIPIVLNRPLDPRTLSLFAAKAVTSARGEVIFAESPAMRATLHAVEKAVASDGGVLICGESGSGRQLLAREIHARTAGPAAPFVRIDSADTSGEQLELALFGTLEAGPSGNGERRRTERIGRQSAIAEAQGGTIFLEHLADAPARIQSRLARVLRDGEVLMRDGRTSTAIDVRPIASTDPSWDLAVADGRIRLDLARRVSVIRVEVPPLRNRREDIPQLAAAMVQSACAARHVPLKTIEPSGVALLTALPWRGNGRELQALLEILVAHVPGTVLRLEDVLSAVSLDGGVRTLPTGTLREARARFERDYIRAVVERHRGRMGEAAKALGIQRTNLYRKMRTLKVPRRAPTDDPTALSGPLSDGRSDL